MVKCIEAVGLALVLVAATTGFHYEAVRALLHRFQGRQMSRPRLVRLLVTLVMIHGAEVGLYAGAYAFSADVLGMGGLTGEGTPGIIDFSYFAAETYSTLGYGDLVPTGGLRVMATVEALNGVLLLTLSGAFLSGILRDSYLRETRRVSDRDGADDQ
ncbi:MAG TPA: potassium channel family protein [Steroidobacteraceae bacterium]|jgi:hypothetical protein|nr:potassium channel family protein [Steroidobacteraceae bacterium]